MTTQGSGGTTSDKERAFRAQFDINLAIARTRGRYFHCDLNAGTGFNQEIGVEGSPLLFLRACVATGHPSVTALFVDMDPAACHELRSRILGLALPPSIEWEVRCEDNRQTLQRLVEQPVRYDLGSILADPNGHGRSANGRPFGTDYPALIRLLEHQKHLDAIINVNVRFMCNAQAAHATGKWKFDPEFFPGLREITQRIPRAWWQIQYRRAPGPGDHFAMLVGRNTANPFRDHAAQGIYRVEGKEGQSLMLAAETCSARPDWYFGQSNFLDALAS